MLNFIKVLTNVKDVNYFVPVSTIELREGTAPLDFYIQLWQSDLTVTGGLRYVPLTLSTMTVEFLRADVVGPVNTSRKVSKTATVAYATDPSIWKITLTSADITNITTGGFRVTLVENSGTVPSPVLKTTVLWSEMSIRKLPSSEVGI